MFERVGGYAVTLDRKPEGLNPCRIGREYKDPRDHDAENAVVVGRIGEALVIALVYEKWNWQKGRSYRARFSIDDAVVEEDAQWIGQGMALVLTTPATILPRLRAGKRIVLGFRDGDADFELAGFSPAYDAMLRCDAAAADSGARSVEAPLPSESRVAAYLMGVTLQDLVRRCDIPTTARQRTGLDERVAALRPEMAPVEAGVRAAMETPACSTAGAPQPTETRAAEALAAYVARTPEAFVEEWERRGLPMLARAKPILAAARPAEEKDPNAPKLAAYAFGLLMQGVVRDCDLATTARQRAGLDARVAALQADLAAYEAAMRDQIKRRAGTCPDAGGADDLRAKLDRFIAASPEVFAAEMDKGGEPAK